MTSTRPVPQGHSHVQSAFNRKKRAGHAGAVMQDEVDEDGAFISSSRDASEEDNDDASGYSDSASSLRLSHKRQSSLARSTSSTSGLGVEAQMSMLPTSARDRAVAESRPGPAPLPGASAAVPINKKIATADKTPSSSSPPFGPNRAIDGANAGSVVGTGGAKSKRDAANPAVSSTLAQATSALSSASSAELVPKSSAALPDAIRPALRRQPSNSSAGSDFPAVESQAPPSSRRVVEPSHRGDSSASGGENRYHRKGDDGLHLGALPPANPHPIGGATPKAEVTQPLKPATSTRSAGTSHSRKTSALGGDPSVTAAISGGETETPAEGGTHNDPDGTTPYDGDVEFAARTPVTQQAALGKDSTARTHIPTLGATAAHGGSAPAETKRNVWATSPLAPSELHQEPLRVAAADEIRSYFYDAIYHPKPGARDYSINQPIDGGNNPNRPIRIYADGVYDLFHYAHALQLRQAKLAFPHVHLIVGVCSSSVCAAHKNEPVLTSAERYEAVRNCRWVDEVLEDAPWVIDQTLLDKLRLDYVAHDEEPYAGSGVAGPGQGSSDIYRFAKDQGKFLPTQRTPGVSTSDLLARIVNIYQSHGLDQKLRKIGKSELLSR